MPYCNPCDRWFSNNGYSQHINTSAAHRLPWESYDWDCEFSGCNRSFVTEHARDQHHANAANHPYCEPCDRMFQNENNLRQHQHSKAHVGDFGSIACPFCKQVYTTASGVTIHLESGVCVSGLNRAKINDIVRQLDKRHVITRPMITMPGYDFVEVTATERAWNGSAYECYLCERDFTSLRGLDNHIKSPVHEQAMYRCPKAGCRREFKLLSGLVQHVESESCGLMRFGQVQQQAKKGVQNMVGRMITG